MSEQGANGHRLPKTSGPHAASDMEGRLAAAEGGLGALAHALEELATNLTDEQKQVRATLGRLQSSRSGSAATVSAETSSASGDDSNEVVTGWAAQADATQWAALVTWVDEWISTYDVPAELIHPCWPLHGAVVEELASLWMAWDQAARASAESGWTNSEALAYWHDRYLPGVLQRLSSLWAHKLCKSTKHEDPAPQQLTDQSVVVIRATGELLADALAEQQTAAAQRGTENADTSNETETQ